jgi:hypothetical protein
MESWAGDTVTQRMRDRGGDKKSCQDVHSGVMAGERESGAPRHGTLARVMVAWAQHTVH